MASYATRCFCIFFLLALSFALEIQARESMFFSKYFHHHRKIQENTDNISLSPTQSPSLAPAPAVAPETSDIVEHGYGLYGREPVTTANAEGDVKYVSAVGEVKYVEAEGLGKKTFRDFVMPNSNDYGNGWNRNGNGNGNGNEKENRNGYESEKQGMSDTRFLEKGKYYYDVNDEKNGNGNEKQEMSAYMEENNFPENEGNENRNGYEAEKQETGEKKYLVNGKYYSGYVTKSENGNEKQGMSEYVEDENSFPENKGNGNEKQGEYVEDENSFPENKKNGNGYETEKEEMDEKKYLVNGKYYSGYVTGSKNRNGNEKQGMSEYVEDENSFPENKENGNGYETEKEETGEKKYLVNGKYYSGYVTGSKNKNGNEKQGMSEYVEDEYSFPENKGNAYHETENQEIGEKKYFVNGKYYSGYVTKSENGNENEKQGMMSEYAEDENRYPENKGNGNGYETEKEETGEKKYLVNGKYYSGYVTKSGNGNENEKQGMTEYVEDENSFPENKWNGYENEKQEAGEKKYLVNGKYYSGYVTKSGYADHKSHNYDNYKGSGAFNNKNEYANGHNENEFYDGNNEYMREGQEQEYGERQNEYAP